MQGDVETQFLIVGSGPAGASLACFLARYGLKGLLINAAAGTADTPRAHMTNLAALDALRDIGLAEECYRLGHQGSHTKHFRWTETLAEEEYGRIFTWGNDPKRVGDYAAASPNPGMLDLPQNLLEPLLVKNATTQGFRVQFSTQLISVTKDEACKKAVAVVRDLIRQVEYRIICDYLFGCEGGRSVAAANLPMQSMHAGGNAWNVQVRAEAGHLMEGREGNLHWNLFLKRDYPWAVNVRMVKPWHEWMMICLPKTPGLEAEAWEEEKWKELWRVLVNDSNAEVEVLNIAKWAVNETCAAKYSDGNIICLGDAVHRHPPNNGLGSNTCIGDSFNLAWKVNLVTKGIASPTLLQTYDEERQPVGAQLVRESNKTLRRQRAVWDLLGVKGPGRSLEEREAGVKLLEEDSAEGRAAREELDSLFIELAREGHALGLEMGQRYEGAAVHDADEPNPWKSEGREAEDPILYYEPCTYPGRRLPHVWLVRQVDWKRVSTVELAGRGDFCLFTGIGGQKWKQAATDVGESIGLKINAVSIGRGQDWEDMYRDWYLKRGVEEDGCVLVRPDIFCAWRSQICLASQEECSQKLSDVMKSILGWK